MLTSRSGHTCMAATKAKGDAFLHVYLLPRSCGHWSAVASLSLCDTPPRGIAADDAAVGCRHSGCRPPPLLPSLPPFLPSSLPPCILLGSPCMMYVVVHVLVLYAVICLLWVAVTKRGFNRARRVCLAAITWPQYLIAFACVRAKYVWLCASVSTALCCTVYGSVLSVCLVQCCSECASVMEAHGSSLCNDGRVCCTGQVLIMHTIRCFGALAFATIMTSRQFVSVLASCLIFAHPLSLGQW